MPRLAPWHPGQTRPTPGLWRRPSPAPGGSERAQTPAGGAAGGGAGTERGLGRGQQWGLGLPQHSPGWGLLSGPEWEDFLGKTLKSFGRGRVVPRLAPPGTWAPQEPRTFQGISGTRGTHSPRDEPPVLSSQLCLSPLKPLWTQPCAGAVLAFAMVRVLVPLAVP